MSSNGNNNNHNHNHIDIEWRRSKVLELSSQGHTLSEIATILRVTQPTVNKDLAHLRKQAQENLQHHIHETIPEEYQRCMVGMKRNLKQILEIGDAATDPRIKLEARRTANDCYKYIMDLCTGSVIVTDSINYIQCKMDHLNNQQKKILQESIKEELKAEENQEEDEEDEEIEDPNDNVNGEEKVGLGLERSV